MLPANRLTGVEDVMALDRLTEGLIHYHKELVECTVDMSLVLPHRHHLQHESAYQIECESERNPPDARDEIDAPSGFVVSRLPSDLSGSRWSTAFSEL
jgi:hypothetical protein